MTGLKMYKHLVDKLGIGLATLFSVGITLSPLYAQDSRDYSEPATADIPRQVFFGDLHLHTNNSADAYALDTISLTPADAYRFARGGAVKDLNGEDVRLRRPLDFLAVTDHAEFLGIFVRLLNGDPSIVETKAGQSWTTRMKEEGVSSVIFNDFVQLVGYMPSDGTVRERLPTSVYRSVWRDVVETADDYNDPGRFTTFAGYEWSSMPEGNSVHRVVLFKDSADKVLRALPFSSEDSTDPEDLWQVLASYEAETGGDVLAIPHNGNLSRGMMFRPLTHTGKAFNRKYVEERAKWEPLYEVTQVKGTSEAHPFLSKTDEFANFELWDDEIGKIGSSAKKAPSMLRHEYARTALGIGIALEQSLGANPYKFGLVGGSDIHTALATTAEDNFFGKFPESYPSAERASRQMAGTPWTNWRLSASGLTAVWARENTRDELFNAMNRKEVYATTGSRIVVRFFGGWSFVAKDAVRPNFVDIGYRKGVPMGGDLDNSKNHTAPSFLVVAAKDPDGPNLDRIQIIKGWVDVDGMSHERIYNVSLSDGRLSDPSTGKVLAVGSTVDPEDATYTNSIGDAHLSAVWKDPDFDADQSAFYYARVIEIPAPRWTAYDAAHYDVERNANIPMTVQDRAFTSPIWYTPN
ncbi:MAG: DUF3604 domain-containing protein [Gammaproteobacteria bacterium]|nr:DUF3604 domain-containing protein [Gammaproteobacteria bacterium]